MALRANVRFKADDIWDCPDDGKRYEVIDGQLYVSPAPSWQHQRGSTRLLLYVGPHVIQRGLGEIVSAPVGIKLDDENGVQPHLVYISNERAHIIVERGVEGAPDLVVEVLSPSTQARDCGVKLRRYAAAGVLHYWILDPVARAIEERVLGPDGYELVGVFGPGSVFRPRLFPGLEIPIDDLWR
jgi:Uma2 family endonuclease